MQDQNQPSPEIETDETALDSETIKELNRKGLRYVKWIILVVLILLFYNSCMSHPTIMRWEEAVKLSDGHVINVKRQATYTFVPKVLLAEGSMIKNMMFTMEVTSSTPFPPPPVWKFNALPYILDYDREKETWFIVATNIFCESWDAAGKPLYGYWQYELKDNQWLIVPLDKKFIGRSQNLYIPPTGDNNWFVSRKITVEDTEQQSEKRYSFSWYKYVKAKGAGCGVPAQQATQLND